MANCKICEFVLVSGNNYPTFIVDKDKGIDICNDCWLHRVPKHIPDIQKEKYLMKKNTHEKL